MKKLRLDLEQLAVESFASSGVRDGLGTVHGNSGDDRESCACTVIAHYCYPDSNIMDCVQDPSRGSTCEGCPIDP
jgi:hypothetical protein